MDVVPKPHQLALPHKSSPDPVDSLDVTRLFLGPNGQGHGRLRAWFDAGEAGYGFDGEETRDSEQRGTREEERGESSALRAIRYGKHRKFEVNWIILVVATGLRLTVVCTYVQRGPYPPPF